MIWTVALPICTEAPQEDPTVTPTQTPPPSPPAMLQHTNLTPRQLVLVAPGDVNTLLMPPFYAGDYSDLTGDYTDHTGRGL